MESITFDLQDLDEEFWSNVVFFQIYHSSGLGGPGALWLVTEEKKKYYLGFEDLPFNEFFLAENLNELFEKTDEWDGARHPYLIENNGWIYLKGLDITVEGEALIRKDIYEAFRKVALNKELVNEKARYGFYDLPAIVGLALGTDSLERVDYIRSVKAQEKHDRLMEEAHAEYERKKLLPEHIVWKPMHMNNIADNPVVGEYALIINKTDDKITARKFTIFYQPHMIEPMHLDPSKGTECYVLFEKSYDEIYGQLEYPTSENKGAYSEENYQCSRHQLAYFDWASFSEGDMFDYGRFIRCFKTSDEAKEYALCFANANGGDRFTLITNLDPKEDQKRRVERFEAYRAYQKYYKKILDVIVNADIYSSDTSGGGAYLLDAILEGVPEISETQLMYIRHDLPWVLEKRTQDTIEKELQRSLEIIKTLEGENV